MPRPLACALLAIAFESLACGSDERTIETPEGKVTFSEDGQEVTARLEGADGFEVTSSTGGEVALPEDFPADLPVMPGAKAITVSRSRTEGLYVMWQASSPAQEVVAFYKQKLAADGWVIEREMDLGSQKMLIVGKDDREANVMVGGADDQVQIVLRLTQKSG
jgi:hypothetical protein